ncbi:LacI family DNA-binding transcriptional regulator [Plantactinospora sp. KBS50]|uniref:LacI family DNA-binding transcriptional regulator n=1 Tax=Plantactinospora sp. KBS50 TaxID=2024580 RepID=UPI000BAABCB3|nr:LacI family DNA-binding transcriptional regulator [Plantactinospora sp. KBS50]ASW54354.1 LacI family transcriptional regulator [Plantactinospora sp. KBS50]
MGTVRRVATLDDVAQLAGVSRSTASRVIAGGSASPVARDQVVAAVNQLGYVPNQAARALARRAGVRLVVAMVGPGPEVLDDPYLDQAVAAVARVCAAQQIGVALEWLPLHPSPVLDRLAEDPGLGGLILLNPTAPLLDRLAAAVPGRAVSIGIGAPRLPSFVVDNAAGTAALVRHLYASGRRRIAMVTGPAWLPCAARPVRAYAGLMRESGLPVRLIVGDFSAKRGRSAAREVLRRWPDTDAVVGASDATALGVIDGLRGLGVRVPDDIGVTGFDDVPFAALSAPALTTADHPVSEIATAAAYAALGQRPAPPEVIFPSHLVLRSSA